MGAATAGSSAGDLDGSNTVDLVRRFAVFTGTSPWEWLPGDVEDWATELLSAPNALARSTVRNYLNQIAMFCDYVMDTRYGWAERCLEYFGTHPVQLCHEDNMPSHSAPYEGRPEVRALTRRELQDFFDYADEQVVRIRAAGRKGWAPAFRNATVFKVLYGWGSGAGKPRNWTWLISPGTRKLRSSGVTAPAT
jgi:integrase